MPIAPTGCARGLLQMDSKPNRKFAQCASTRPCGASPDNRAMNWNPTLAIPLFLLCLAACSPALNWRSMPLPNAGITITLPCKPDQATRSVELAGAVTELSMVGCDADGATFAVSHAALGDPAQVGVALTHWRAAVLANLGTAAAASAVDVPYTPKGALPLRESVRTAVLGERPEGGGSVFAQGVWFARAAGPQIRLYHAVVYTRKPRPEVADQFFASLEFQP
jgi:hypothetical protein